MQGRENVVQVLAKWEIGHVVVESVKISPPKAVYVVVKRKMCTDHAITKTILKITYNINRNKSILRN